MRLDLHIDIQNFTLAFQIQFDIENILQTILNYVISQQNFLQFRNIWKRFDSSFISLDHTFPANILRNSKIFSKVFAQWKSIGLTLHCLYRDSLILYWDLLKTHR